MPLILHNGSLLRVGGALANDIACCCNGECSCCENPPGSLTLTYPKMSSWDAIHDNDTLCFHGFGDPPYLCWPNWAPAGGCAKCGPRSEASITLSQPPTHNGPNCDGEVVDCDGFSCAANVTDCLWTAQEMVCTEDPPTGMGFSGMQSASCCGNEWLAGPGEGQFAGVAPFNGPALCDGTDPSNWCDNDFIDPATFARTCNCNDCCDDNHDGISTCAGGCCFMGWREDVTVSCSDPEFVTVTVRLQQFRRWKSPIQNNTALIEFFRVIPIDDWDCFQTPVDFRCGDWNPINSLGNDLRGLFCPYYETENPAGLFYTTGLSDCTGNESHVLFSVSA